MEVSEKVKVLQDLIKIHSVNGLVVGTIYNHSDAYVI